jgi:hypothetical protein
MKQGCSGRSILHCLDMIFMIERVWKYTVIQGCIFFNELWFFPPPSFQIWFFSPYLYYISLKGLYLIVILWNKWGHRQNEIKMKENWRKWNFEGNFNALNFDQNQEKVRKNHFGKWKHWFSPITHGIFLFFSLCLSIFPLFFDFLP